MKAKKTPMGLENEVVARVPRGNGSPHGAILTAKQIKTLPPNVVIGTLTVLEKPEPIRKRRPAKRRQR